MYIYIYGYIDIYICIYVYIWRGRSVSAKPTTLTNCEVFVKMDGGSVVWSIGTSYTLVPEGLSYL